MRKILYSLLFFGLLLGPVCTHVFGWTEGDYTTGWVTRDDDLWESDYSGEGASFEYTTDDYADFQMYSCEISLLDVELEGYWVISSMSQIYSLTLTDDTHLVEILIEHFNKLFFFGAISQKTQFQVYLDGLPQFMLHGPYTYSNVPVALYFYRNATDTLSVTVVMDEIIHRCDLTLTEGWFDSVTLTQGITKIVAWGGIGSIEGIKTNEILQSGEGAINDPTQDLQELSWVELLNKVIFNSVQHINDIIQGNSGETVYHRVTMEAPDEYEGTTTPDAGEYIVEHSSFFSMSVETNEGWYFTSWLINGTSYEYNNPQLLEIRGDTTIKPLFVPIDEAPEAPATFLEVLLQSGIGTICIVGGVGFGFSQVARLIDHPMAGFMIGGAIGLMFCAQGGLVPMPYFIAVLIMGSLASILWFRSGS